MGLTLDEDELWEFVTRSHTGIVTTLTKEGWPVTLPTWFVVLGREIWFRTPAKAKKVHRILHDTRGAFLVESGEQWAELKAVHLRVELEVVDDPGKLEEVNGALEPKYARYRTAPGRLPDSTKAHYRHQVAVRATPVGSPISWDNARIRLRG